MVPLIASVAAVFFGIIVVLVLICWCMTQRRRRRSTDYIGASPGSVDSLDEAESMEKEKVKRIDIDEATKPRKVNEKRVDVLPLQDRSRVLLDVKRLSSPDVRNMYDDVSPPVLGVSGFQLKSNGRVIEKFHREDGLHSSRATRVRRARVYSAGSSGGNRASVVSFDREQGNHINEKQQQCSSTLSLASMQRTSSPAGQAGQCSVQHYREKGHRRVPDTQYHTPNYEIVDQEDEVFSPVPSMGHPRHHESVRLLPCGEPETCGCEMNRTSNRCNRSSLADCAESEEVAVLMDPHSNNMACQHHSSRIRCQHHCSRRRHDQHRSRRRRQPYFCKAPCESSEPPDANSNRTSHVETRRVSSINDPDLPPYESVISSGCVETRMSPNPPCLDCSRQQPHLPTRPTSQPPPFAGSPTGSSPCHHHQSPPPSYSRHCPRTPQTWSQTDVSVTTPPSRGNLVWSRASYNHRGSIEDDGVYTNNERGESSSNTLANSESSSTSKNSKLSHELSV